MDGAFEVVDACVLDGGDSDLAVDPPVDLAVVLPSRRVSSATSRCRSLPSLARCSNAGARCGRDSGSRSAAQLAAAAPVCRNGGGAGVPNKVSCGDVEPARLCWPVGIVRTKRPTIWRNTSDVLAADAYTPTRKRGISTPSETMFTATIHGSRASVNAASLSAALGSVCSTTNARCRSPRAAARRSFARESSPPRSPTRRHSGARRRAAPEAWRRLRAGSAAAHREAPPRSPCDSGGWPRAVRTVSKLDSITASPLRHDSVPS